MLAELSNTGDAIRYAIKLKDRDFLEDATSENEWVRHHLQLARHLADDEWDAVAFAYGEGTVVRALLEGYPSDMWADEAERIVGLVDAGRDVLRARAESRGPRARRLEPS